MSGPERFAHHQGAFGTDRFGQLAERLARFFGTPKYIIAQSVFVLAWVALNSVQLIFAPFDPKPYILLNLGFSTQAAYAAPLILLAQTRQADRDKAQAEVEASHREALAAEGTALLTANTKLTEATHTLAREVHELVLTDGQAEPKREPPAAG